MVSLTLGAVCLNQTPLDWSGNVKRITQALGRARSEGVSILCTPELCLTGYGCEDQFFSPCLHREAELAIAEIVPCTKGIVAAIGMPLPLSSGLYDSACLIADGQIRGFVCKQFLAREGIHYEPRWFRPWVSGEQTTVSMCGAQVPVGDLVFDFSGVRVGFEICEDAWAADRPGARLSSCGVDIILNPSASHFAFAKNEIRKRFVLEGSRAFGCCYVYANALGNEAGRAIYDGSCFIALHGEMLVSGPRFSFADFCLTTAPVDIDSLRLARVRTHSYEGGRKGAQAATSPSTVSFAHSIGPVTGPPKRELYVGWEQSPHLKEEEFARAVSLGLYDYMRKSHSRGFVVSLSGGADSAACACLVALMVQVGVAEIGLSDFASRSGIDRLVESRSAREMVARLLTCVFQSTKNNSSTTRQAAQTVSSALGARYIEFSIDELVQSYERLISGALGLSLSWQQHDIALQNIQARTRSPGVWMIANLEGFLLLATSNRSEAAVGYTTMDGDTSGSLSPIGGVDKAFLRKWLKWLEREGPLSVGSIPHLGVINSQDPTAELRPLERRQTDEADLMPYDLLDSIERSAIRDKLGPVETWRKIHGEYPQYSREQTKQWVTRFFVLWCRNQWKRERYAPCFHLDDENLDPKTWCRFPILSGGFERELERLKTA